MTFWFDTGLDTPSPSNASKARHVAPLLCFGHPMPRDSRDDQKHHTTIAALLPPFGVFLQPTHQAGRQAATDNMQRHTHEHPPAPAQLYID